MAHITKIHLKCRYIKTLNQDTDPWSQLHRQMHRATHEMRTPLIFNLDTPHFVPMVSIIHIYMLDCKQKVISRSLSPPQTHHSFSHRYHYTQRRWCALELEKDGSQPEHLLYSHLNLGLCLESQLELELGDVQFHDD